MFAVFGSKGQRRRGQAVPAREIALRIVAVISNFADPARIVRNSSAGIPKLVDLARGPHGAALLPAGVDVVEADVVETTHLYKAHVLPSRR